MLPLFPSRAPGNRLFRLTVIAVGLALMLTPLSHGQVSPEEHEKHHPGLGEGKPAAMPPAGPRAGAMGGMEGMGCMDGMGAGQPRELYPSLMSLPDLTPEKRDEIQNQANERLHSGTALWSAGLEALAQAAENEDYAAMQEALTQVRQGLEQFESGVAARRALAEGKAPRNVALQWFKQEMNLLPPAAAEARGGLFGLSWFHLFVMVALIGFAAAMLGMYFFKMQRAAQLLRDLTSAVNGQRGSGGVT